MFSPQTSIFSEKIDTLEKLQKILEKETTNWFDVVRDMFRNM